MNDIKVKSIIIAVSNKQSIDSLMPVLKKHKVEIWGTEGTTNYILEKGFEAESIVSGFDFDGRVKSLDKRILGRVLADSKQSHLDELARMGVEPVQAVVVELYKLDKKAFPESMDIGGVTMIRGAIKNFKNVVVAFDEASIKELADHLEANQGQSLLEFRKKQAKKAIEYIAERNREEAELF